MIISVKHQPTSRFDSDEYLIDLDRKFEGYEGVILPLKQCKGIQRILGSISAASQTRV